MLISFKTISNEIRVEKFNNMYEYGGLFYINGSEVSKETFMNVIEKLPKENLINTLTETT